MDQHTTSADDGFEELPQRRSHRGLAVLGLVAAGGIAAGGTFALVGAANASAPGGSSSSSSSAPAGGTSGTGSTASGSAAQCAPGQRPAGGPAGGPGKNAPKPSANDDDGTITSVSSDSIMVKDHSGNSRTYSITSSTTVHHGPQTTLSVSNLKSGEHVHVRGSKSGSSYTATDIDVPPTPPAGGPKGGPANGGPGKNGSAPAPKSGSNAPSMPAPSTSTSG